MIPIPAVWWLLGYVIRLLCVAISLQALGLLASARTWDDRGFLAFMVIPGLTILIAWYRRGSRAVRRLCHRRVRV
jgi:hypothetical protein